MMRPSEQSILWLPSSVGGGLSSRFYFRYKSGAYWSGRAMWPTELVAIVTFR